MFERFTERARQVVVLAQDEARALRHNYIGTEHLLLALLREEEGIAAAVLDALDVSLDGVRDEVAKIVGEGDELQTGQIPFTPRAKKVLELSLREALGLGDNYIETEHLLLGLVRENEGVAARILLDFGITPEGVRDAVIRSRSGGGLESAAEYEPSSPPLAQEVIDEIERLVETKRAATEEHRWEDAAAADERRRRLVRAARELERAWRNEPRIVGRRAQLHGPRSSRTARFGGASSYGARRPPRTNLVLLLGWLLFAVALGVGIAIGWAIWG